MARWRRRRRDGEAMAAPGTMAALLEDFLEWERTRNYSEDTIYGHSRQIPWLIRWCEERSISRPEEVTRPILERFQRYLFHYRKANGRPLSWGSQRTHLGSVRVFFKWLARSGYILYNPAADLELPRPMRKLPKAVLTAAEADLVLQQPDVSTPLGLRDRAILELLYSTGIRRAETANLDVWDVDFDAGLVKIRLGKYNKDRIVPLGDRAAAWIQKYLHDSRRLLVVEPDDDALFLSRFGGRLSPNKYTQRVKQAVEAAGIAKTGGCHLFRHTMATLMLEGGADVRFIQEMLGHERLETTQIYTHVSVKKLKRVHELTHPASLERPAKDAGDVDELLEQLEAEAAAEVDSTDDGD
jgi:integrase/recombinase XerD